MPHTIAVAGKGGVGKTTTCGMIIDYLCKKGQGPLLVVDADANSNLNEVLGIEVETTLGAIREEMAQAEMKGTIPAGMTKADYAEFKFNSALIEEARAATAMSTASSRPRWISTLKITATSSWTMKRAWSMWPEGPFLM